MNTSTDPTLPAVKTPAPTQSALSTLNVAIIGVSGFAKVHHQMIKNGIEREFINLRAATVINQDEEREKCAELRKANVKLYQDYQDMLRDWSGKIDLCFIPTGIHLHARMTIDALKAGANVIVEKPAAATIQEIKAMQAAEKKYNRFVSVGYQNIFAPEILTMKQAILDGQIGKLESIKCMGLWPRYESYYQRNNWAGRLRLDDDWLLDSPFNNAISHQLNMVCFLAGETLKTPATIRQVQAELYRARDIEGPDTACMRGISQSGVSLYFFGTHSTQTKIDPMLQINGDRGRIEWDFKQTRIYPQTSEPTIHQNLPMPIVRENMVEQLVLRAQDSDVFICDLKIAQAHTLFVNGAHESSAIHSIPVDQVTTHETNGDRITEIHGIEMLIEKAYQEEKLFSELGCNWAVPGEIIDLSHYERFPTFRDFSQ